MPRVRSSCAVVLPPNAEPRHYVLSLSPNMETFTFDGTVDVTVDIVEETSTLVLHSKELTYLGKTTFTGADGTSTKATTHTVDHDRTTVTFTFASSLAVGLGGILHIDFQGELNADMCGFYRSTYKNVRGESKFMLSTQFEALDARRCFPCWDEPARKATFGTKLIVDEGLTAFSNMPVTEQTLLAGGKKSITFADTPKMSSYLLAFVVGEFDYLQAHTKDGVAIRVYTPPGQTEQGRFSLDVAVKSIEFYDDYFGVKYPLPKLDMVAIPEFAAGAMENWGLVTYRSIDLLIDAETASSVQLQRVCTVVTHELAHQWFGNLVTMEWWDDLWLNEGFASWMMTFVADVLFPSWAVWPQYCSNEMARAMSLDSLRTSHPIQVPIKEAEEVEQVFDAISYFKGGSVVRMVHAVIGAEHFRSGLALYFKRHAYGNTVTTDLWAAWEEVSGKPIGAMMATWTEQMGFPLVTVASNAEGGAATLTQSWFLADGSSPTEEEISTRKPWTIPIFAASATPGQTTPIFVGFLDETSKTFENASFGANTKFNAGQHVLCRTAYTDEAQFYALIEACRAGAFEEQDRSALLNDAYALSKAGLLSPSLVLELAAAMCKDTSTIVWEEIESVLRAFEKLTRGNDKMHAQMMSFGQMMLTDLDRRVGWTPKEDDGHMGKMLRAVLVRLQAAFCRSDEDVAAKAHALFDTPDLIPNDLKAAVYKIALQCSSPEEGAARHATLMERFSATEDPARRKEIMTSIGAVPSAELKLEVMEWTSVENKIQDFFYPMGSIAGSSAEGQTIAFDYMTSHWGEIRARVSKASASLTNAVISSCCAGFTTAAKADEIEAFFVANPCECATRRITQLLEGMRNTAKFVDTHISGSPLAEDGFWAGLTGSVIEACEV